MSTGKSPHDIELGRSSSMDETVRPLKKLEESILFKMLRIIAMPFMEIVAI
jgi:hypothetical protein